MCTCALGQITLPVPKQDVEHPTHVELEFFPPILYPDLMLREFDWSVCSYITCHIPYSWSACAQICAQIYLIWPDLTFGFNLLTRGLGMKLTVINPCSPTRIQKIQPTHKVINVVQWTNKPWKQIMRFVTLFGIIKCLGCNIWCRPRERNTTTRKTAKAIWNRRSKVYHLWCYIRIADDRWIAFQI